MRLTIFKLFGGNVLGAAIGMLSTLVLTRCLSLEEYGKVTLLFSVIALMQGLVSFGFNNAIAVYLNRQGCKLKATLLTEANIVFYIYFSVAMIVLIVFLYISSIVYHFDLLDLLVMWLLVAAFTFTSYLISINQAFEQWNTYSILNILNSFVRFLCLLIGVGGAYFFNLDRYLVVLIALSLYVFFYTVIVIAQNKEHLGAKRSTAANFLNVRYWEIVLPIGFTNLIIVLSMRLDALIVERSLGVEALGIYSLALSLAAVFPLLTSALMNVYLVQASKEHGSQNFISDLVGQQVRYVFPVVIVGVFISFLSSYFIPLIFGYKFVAAVKVFNILLIAYLGGIVFTPLESHLYANKQRVIMIIKFIQLMCVVFFANILVNFFGLNGVALAIVFSRVVGWMCIAVMVRKEMSNVCSNV